MLELLNGDGDLPTSWGLMLFKDTFAPVPTSVYADFLAAAAAYTGYAVATPTMSGPLVSSGGLVELIGSNEVFEATGSAAGDTVGGAMLYAIVAGAPAVNTSVLYWTFDVPVIFAVAGDFLGFKPLVQLPLGASEAVLEV